jgi:hypothetical protein
VLRFRQAGSVAVYREFEPHMGGAVVNAPPGCHRFDDQRAAAADVVRTSPPHRAFEASALIDALAAKDLSVEPKRDNDLAVPIEPARWS